MRLEDIVAEQIQTGDCFLLAGELFRVGAVNTYINGTVGIQFYDLAGSEAPQRLELGNLTLHQNQRMTIIKG